MGIVANDEPRVAEECRMVDTQIIRTCRKPCNKQLPTNEFFDRRNSQKTAGFFVCKNPPQKTRFLTERKGS